MKQSNSAVGYLPEEQPSFIKLLFYGIQQVIVMFPATVTVALVTGFQVSTTIFASGLATLCFLFITGRKIPLYYGSSFAYLTAIAGMCAAQGFEKVDGILPTEAIQYAQFGIICSGLISIAAGLLVKFFGKKVVETILPASITGPVAMIIGLTLAGNALGDAIPTVGEEVSQGMAVAWTIVALVTLLSTILYARYLKGFLGQLPLLLGVVTGSVVAGLFYAGGSTSSERCPPPPWTPPCGSWGTALSSRCPPSPCPRSPGRLWRPLCPLPSPPFPSPPPTCTSWTSTSTTWPGKRAARRSMTWWACWTATSSATASAT